jgi:RNA polymerase sigma factor (sigma-70 family)
MKRNNIDLTEDELAEKIQIIARRIAPKFKFGYFEVEDLVQEAVIDCLKALHKYDGERSLDNFLYSVIHSRLFNLKRNKFARPNKPCLNCPLKAYKNEKCELYEDLEECSYYHKWVHLNSAKKSLASPSAPIDAGYNDFEDNKEAIEKIEGGLDTSNRKSWIILKNGDKLPKQKLEELTNKIREILHDQ